MYCYVLKLLFLTPTVVQPKSSCDVHLLRSPWLRSSDSSVLNKKDTDDNDKSGFHI